MTDVTSPKRPAPDNPDSFRRLVDIMERLLAPDGCPWDREQTHQSLRPYVIEEAYEVREAIDEGDMRELRDELGDLGLQIVFHSALARREGHFDIDDVYRAICEKLIRRHPHVFGETVVDGSGEVLRNWEAIKRAEREAKGGAEKPPSALDGVPMALPALQRAQRIQTKARRVGFDWDTDDPAWDKIHEEIEELREGRQSMDPDEMEDEFGDVLFSLVNVARLLGVDPEEALHRTNRKFVRRFHYIEARAREMGRKLEDMTLAEMDAIWEEAKTKAKG
ncbi:MAG: nucleoside triphosphate pyrophosphohydrolase [Sumerlaeia bacterium]